MKFECSNPDCERLGNVVEEVKVVFVYEGTESLPKLFCYKCGKRMTNITEILPLSDKNIQFGAIASMSKEDKVKVLRKRTHNHFNKEIRDRKEGLMGQAIKEMKRGVK